MNDRRVGAAADDRSEAVAQTLREPASERCGLRGHVEFCGVFVDVGLEPASYERKKAEKPGEKVAHRDGVAEKGVADVADLRFVLNRFHPRYGADS